MRARHAATAPAVDTTVELGPLSLRSPIVAASGTFGHSDEVLRIGDSSRIGAVTVKSLAAFPWVGNPAPRLHAGAGGGMLNSVGLQGPGVDAWIRDDWPALHAHGVPVIVSIWGRTVEDFAAAMRAIGPIADALAAVEVNVSCPNVEDSARMFAHDPAATGAVIAAVRAVGLDLPVFAKLSPNTWEVVAVARAAIAAGATGLTLVNTLLGMGIDAETKLPQLGNVTGGYSGDPVKPVALRIVHEVTRALGPVPVIGTGGVSHGLDAVEMLIAGAAAVGVGTVSFREPRAVNRIHDEVAAWCDAHEVRRVRDLVGTLRAPTPEAPTPEAPTPEAPTRPDETRRSDA